MNLHLTLIVLNILSILISIAAIKKTKGNVEAAAYYYFKKHMEINEIKERLKKEKLYISYDKAIYDILSELPVGSAMVVQEDIDNTIVIRIKKDTFYND